MARGPHRGAARPAPPPCLCIPGQRHPAGPCPYGNQRADWAAWSQARQLVELEGSRWGYKGFSLPGRVVCIPRGRHSYWLIVCFISASVYCAFFSRSFLCLLLLLGDTQYREKPRLVSGECEPRLATQGLGRSLCYLRRYAQPKQSCVNPAPAYIRP
jgi:hypothetical protein